MSFDQAQQNIKKTIQSGETISPFLFLSDNLESTNSQVIDFCYTLFEQYNIPKTSLILLEDTGENIKIEQTRELLRSASIKSSYDFQIFFIENISRLTLGSSNSMLKFLEEPGKGNIVFLTNKSESGVLDTILSRVTPVYLGKNTNRLNENSFFKELLNNLNSVVGKQNLLSYVYSSKLEKQEYIHFLTTLLHSHILSPKSKGDLEDDIKAVSDNNVLPKYVLDKWIMKIV